MSDTAQQEQDGGAEAGRTPSADPATAPPAADPRLLVDEGGVGGYLRGFLRRVRSGELGSLPVVVSLILIALIFQSLNSDFLSAGSLSDIGVYIAGTGIMATGIVFVLLLGEIDLSVGSVAGVGAAVWGVLSVTHGMDDLLAVFLAIGSGLLIGALHGFFFAKVGVPAFVVTLAGFLGWSGLQIWLMGEEGSINTPAGSVVENLTGFYFEDIAWAYSLALLVVVCYIASLAWEATRRRRAGLPSRAPVEIGLRAAVLAAVVFSAAYVLNQSRGLPLALVLFLAVLVIADLVVRRTTFGRQVFAVGGNAEAARRAGIAVERVRITVFAIAGMLAAFGGLFIASLAGGASKNLGGDNTLMNVIAAAVIGGTSLFGGRGKIWSALLGILVIQSIEQGLNLLGKPSEIQFMITGAVLLAAVVIDSLSRRTQRTAGRT